MEKRENESLTCSVGLEVDHRIPTCIYNPLLSYNGVRQLDFHDTLIAMSVSLLQAFLPAFLIWKRFKNEIEYREAL